jgi:hypothetical protein
MVIDSAASLLYSQGGLRQSVAERERNLDLSFKLLEEWRGHLPPELRDIHKADEGAMGDCSLRRMVLRMFRQYHEAIFLLYFPWIRPQSKGRITEETRRKGVELCTNSAQVALTTANQALSWGTLDRYALPVFLLGQKPADSEAVNFST